LKFTSRRAAGFAHDPEKCAPVFHRDKRKKCVCAEIMRKQ